MKKRYIYSVGIIVIAAVLIVIGSVHGEPASVFQKAVNICMECIGIG